MVNVNTHVTSSMELPFGECTLFFINLARGFEPVGEEKLECGSCSGCLLSPELLGDVRVPVEGSSPFVSGVFSRL